MFQDQPTLAPESARLAARVMLVTPEDVKRQALQPGRWLDAADLVSSRFQKLVKEARLDEAEQYLRLAHSVFNEIGLRGPCRAALSGLAHLALEHDRPNGFKAIAAEELRKDLPIPADYQPFLQVALGAQELQSWVAASRTIDLLPELVTRLSKTLHGLLKNAQVGWVEHPAPIDDLKEMRAAADTLTGFSSPYIEECGSDAGRVSALARYLGDSVVALLERTDLSAAEPESPLWSLEYSPQTALEQYLDLTIEERYSDLERFAIEGNQQNFMSVGLKTADCLGRLAALTASPTELKNPIVQLVGFWVRCWKLLNDAPMSLRERMLSAQSMVASTVVDGILAGLPEMDGAQAVEDLAKCVDAILDSRDMKAAKPPPSGLAPLKLLASRLWERVSQLNDDQDAAENALSLSLEACRLLLQQRHPVRQVTADAVATISRLIGIRDLESSERGYLERAKGNLAFRNGDWRKSVGHFTEAALLLKDAASNPSRPGIQNIALSSARSFKDAAEAAMRLGDLDSQVSLLNQAANVLESVAVGFVIPASRENLLSWAKKHRLEAKFATQQRDSVSPLRFPPTT